jgi:hypothetical protein
MIELKQTINSETAVAVAQAAQKCSNCKFWMVDPQNLKSGFCRNKPPSAFPINTQQGVVWMGQFPPVQEAAWCGEWRGKMML